MTFLQRFKLAWAMSKLPAYDMSADLANYWSADDARATSLFFNSHTGYKLKRLLNNFVFRTCYQSVTRETDHAYHAGVGRGVSLAVFELQKTFTLPQAAEEEQKQGEEVPEPTVMEQFAA